MRPRRARLGCQGRVPAGRLREEAASMRPRRVRLGCSSSVRRTDRLEHCFNEAEARTPRMPALRQRDALDSSTRFNEAEARTPRMQASRCIGLQSPDALQ